MSPWFSPTQAGTGNLRFRVRSRDRCRRLSRPRHHRHVSRTLSPSLFVEILLISQQLAYLKRSKISLHGTEIKAEEADRSEIPGGLGIPAELARRDERGPALGIKIWSTSWIMTVSGGGFDQCDNAHASVDNETMLIVGHHLSQPLPQ